MTKPPTQTKTQDDYVQSAVRMPRSLRDEIKETARKNGRPMNAEILSRLQASPIDDLKRQNEEIKRMLRDVLDHVRD